MKCFHCKENITFKKNENYTIFSFDIFENIHTLFCEACGEILFFSNLSKKITLCSKDKCNVCFKSINENSFFIKITNKKEEYHICFECFRILFGENFLKYLFK